MEEQKPKKILAELRQFFPALAFVLKFVGLYVIGNIAYGLMVEYFDPNPDPVTELVARNTASLLTLTGYPTESIPQLNNPNVLLRWNERAVLAVYEGCNGLNVMIVFLAFLLAIGPYKKKIWLFSSIGLLGIHLLNLARIYGLFMVAVYLPHQFYFVHKYFFTAILYVLIFLLWILWFRISGIRK